MHLGNKENYLNTADAYKDIDGNMKQFTHIDHDVKTNISPYIGGDINDIREELRLYRLDKINEILNISASLCPIEFIDYVVKGEGKTKIEWNKVMINDPGFNMDRVVQLWTILENRNSTKFI